MSYEEKTIFGVDDYDQLSAYISQWKLDKKRIVFTNGCFDILHAGHVDYLTKSAKRGDILVIGLNSDASTKKLKGEGRPLYSDMARAYVLLALSVVDYVVIFDEDTPTEIVKIIKPDIFTKGSDYKVGEIAGSDFVKSYGGEVITIPILEGYSTTELLKNVKNLDI